MSTQSPACDLPTASCYPLQTELPKSITANVGINHNINRRITANIGGKSIEVFSTSRDFSLAGSRNTQTGLTSAVYGVPGYVGEDNPNGIVGCGGKTTSSNSAAMSESCTIMSVKLHYADMTNSVVFYERVTDKLSFSVSSSMLAGFRTRYGGFWTHEFWIPKGIKATRRKEFIASIGGSDRTLSDITTTFDPFPETGGAIATGGLGATDINQADLEAAKKADVSGIALILCVPQPPGESTATEADPEILRKGFYDYILMGENLSEEDGGKDFFYPAWCRALTPDPHWAFEAKQRYWYSFDKTAFPETAPPPELQWELAPQCSYAKHPVDGEMWSWVFMDGAGHGQSFSELNGVATNTLLTPVIKPHVLEQVTSYTPISIY